jgi:hypothetical protein
VTQDFGVVDQESDNFLTVDMIPNRKAPLTQQKYPFVERYEMELNVSKGYEASKRQASTTGRLVPLHIITVVLMESVWATV